MGRIREMLRRDLEIMLRSVSELVKHNAERLHPAMENVFSDSDSVSAAAEAEVLEIICVLMLLYFYMYVLILLYILYICPLR